MKLKFPSICVSETSIAPSKDGDSSNSLRVVLMQKLTWLVLLSYFLLTFKPVMPVFMDALAHTFWEKQHLLTVHEVNGKFHVHYELAKASHQSEKDKQAAGVKLEVSECMPVFAAPLTYFAPQYFVKKDTYLCFSCYYPFPSLDKDCQPPKALA